MKLLKITFLITLFSISAVSFADDNFEHPDILFPEVLLSQFLKHRSTLGYTEQDLLDGEVIIYRTRVRTFPTHILKSFIEEEEDEEYVREEYGYSYSESAKIVLDALEDAKSEKEKSKVREELGFTAKEVAKFFISKPNLDTDDWEEISNESLLLNFVDRQSDEMEVLLIADSNLDDAEKAYRNFEMWPEYKGSYLESFVLTPEDIEELDDKFKEKMKFIDNVQWYHFYSCEILGVNWQATNVFRRYETGEGATRKVILRWDQDPLFDMDEDDFWGDDDNPYLNDGINAAGGYLLLQPYVDAEGKLHEDKTVILLKNFMRIIDPSIIDITIIPEAVREATMKKFINDFIQGMKDNF